jgi:hypothetical protein
MTPNEKVVENRIRRKLRRRHRYTLHKNPVRDPLAIGYGSYIVRDAKGKIVDVYPDLNALAIWEDE